MAQAEEQLVGYLSDAHSIEEQALVQMRRAPALAGTPQLAAVFRHHTRETEEHERLMRARLEAHGERPSRVKDAVMKAGGFGFAMFAAVQPDTPGKLAAHAYSYEHLELAAHELLARIADRAGDAETARVARAIAEQEAAMADRLAHAFDATADSSLEQRLDGTGLEPSLVAYLADAHAIEGQSEVLLRRAAELTDDPQLRAVYETHLEQTRAHRALIERRLAAHDARPSTLKDAALRLGGLNWSLFFRAQPDTPAKLAAFGFAVEHLEIAAYEQLTRVATQAADPATAAAAQHILADERSAADRIAGLFGSAAATVV